jgi:hypothetical protein
MNAHALLVALFVILTLAGCVQMAFLHRSPKEVPSRRKSLSALAQILAKLVPTGELSFPVAQRQGPPKKT